MKKVPDDQQIRQLEPIERVILLIDKLRSDREIIKTEPMNMFLTALRKYGDWNVLDFLQDPKNVEEILRSRIQETLAPALGMQASHLLEVIYSQINIPLEIISNSTNAQILDAFDYTFTEFAEDDIKPVADMVKPWMRHAAILHDIVAIAMSDENHEYYFTVEEEDLTDFIYALSVVMPHMIYTKLTGDQTDHIGFTHLANRLACQYGSEKESITTDQSDPRIKSDQQAPEGARRQFTVVERNVNIHEQFCYVLMLTEEERITILDKIYMLGEGTLVMDLSNETDDTIMAANAKEDNQHWKFIAPYRLKEGALDNWNESNRNACFFMGSGLIQLPTLRAIEWQPKNEFQEWLANKGYYQTVNGDWILKGAPVEGKDLRDKLTEFKKLKK